MFGEKKYIGAKYADILLQLAWKYKNENPGKKDDMQYAAMDKVLETMDKYVAFINNMGFMMHQVSIEYMIEYIDRLLTGCCEFTEQELQETKNHLEEIK